MKLLYFAWLRTRIGRAEEEVDPPTDVANVEDLLRWLQGRGAGYAEAPAEARDVGVGMGGKEDDSLRRNMAVVVFQGMTDEASGVAQVSTMSSCICLLCLRSIHAKQGSYPNSPSVPRRREPIQHFS